MKRQLGQFLTPGAIAERLLSKHTLRTTDRVLEPGFGGGAFLLPVIERFLELRDGDLAAVLTENVWGIELDPELHAATLDAIRERWGELPEGHNLVLGDFLLEDYPEGGPREGAASLFETDGFFDLIVGNPPFGGTVNVEHQDELEKKFGRRDGMKIKKETYSFFIVKCLDLVKAGGTIEFICSDTFLTIPTMKGLRKALMDEGSCEVVRLDEFSPETSYPMVVLRFTKGGPSQGVLVNHETVERSAIEATANLSWKAGGEFARYFGGPTLGDFVVCSSGMTTGRNEYFVRVIAGDGSIEEPYEFEFFEDPITLARELERARLGKLSERQQEKIRVREAAGETRRNVRITERETPLRVQLPHPDYRFYNKAQPGVLYSPPKYAVYWKDEGDAVLTYKRNGNWYLHGVGGAPFFGREGLTWKLISARLDMRYLPPGYILDSGAPCAFLREGVAEDELWFILGWTLTDAATAILKGVLNHTMNIQSKDVERLPYPWWVTDGRKAEAIELVRARVRREVRDAAEGMSRGSLGELSLDCLYAED